MRNLLFCIMLMIAVSSCGGEKTHDAAAITDFTISELSNPALVPDTVIIEDSEKRIFLLFSNRFSEVSFPMQLKATFVLSVGATSIPASGETITFHNSNEQVHYTVTSSDGTKTDYYVEVRDNQIPDSGFEDWYTATGMDGRPFSEPGYSAATTAWATANQGTSTFGVYCTTPVLIDGNKAARIVTGETSLVPVTAGTVFTGKFNVDGAINHPTDPKQATVFGTPFSLRPLALKFRYSYKPGGRYVKATLNNPKNIFGGFTVTEIPGNDMFTAYAVLERRTATTKTEVGRAQIFSGDMQETMKEITLTFNYLSAGKPTHIYIVFASSRDGDLFTGAVGSTLTIDDVELIYQ